MSEEIFEGTRFPYQVLNSIVSFTGRYIEFLKQAIVLYQQLYLCCC